MQHTCGRVSAVRVRRVVRPWVVVVGWQVITGVGALSVRGIRVCERVTRRVRSLMVLLRRRRLGLRLLVNYAGRSRVVQLRRLRTLLLLLVSLMLHRENTH